MLAPTSSASAVARDPSSALALTWSAISSGPFPPSVSQTQARNTSAAAHHPAVNAMPRGASEARITAAVTTPMSVATVSRVAARRCQGIHRSIAARGGRRSRPPRYLLRTLRHEPNGALAVERAEPADALAERRVRHEECRDAAPRQRIHRVERRGRRVDVHRQRLRAPLERLESVRERRPPAEELRPRRVGEVLALARHGKLEQHRRQRREDDRRQDADEPQRAGVLVVAAEEQRELEDVR